MTTLSNYIPITVCQSSMVQFLSLYSIFLIFIKLVWVGEEVWVFGDLIVNNMSHIANKLNILTINIHSVCNHKTLFVSLHPI